MRDDLVDEAKVARLVGGHVVGGEREPRDAAAPEHVDPAGDGGGGEEAVVHLAQAEARAVGGDDQVARERQLEPEAERVAVDGRDHDLRQRLDRLERLVAAADEPERVPRVLERHPTEVGAGGERLRVAAGDDDRADAVVVVEAADRVAELVEKRRAARVQLVGPVQRDNRVPLVSNSVRSILPLPACSSTAIPLLLPEVTFYVRCYLFPRVGSSVRSPFRRRRRRSRSR